MKPKRFANLTSVCFSCCMFFSFLWHSYLHHINVPTVFACIFNCSVGYFRVILRLCAFLIHWPCTEVFFGLAFPSDFVYFCRIADFLLSHNANQSFSQLCVIFKYLFCVCSIYSFYDRLQPPLQALLSSFNRLPNKNKQIILTPQRHHLTSYSCIMLCVSALANLSTPLSRRGAFLYSGHIGALMFCAFLLRNSQWYSIRDSTRCTCLRTVRPSLC